MFLAFAITPLPAQEPAWAPPAGDESRQEGDGGILPSSAFIEFRNSLKAAIEQRDWTALKGLYQTNDVTVDQLAEELGRWRPLLEGDPRSAIQTQGTIFRDFSLSHQSWRNLAERLTTHKATHLVQLRTSTGYWMLPLIAIDGRLFIVVSDKSRDMGLRREDGEPNGAMNQPRPVPSNPNSTSGAAGSGR